MRGQHTNELAQTKLSELRPGEPPTVVSLNPDGNNLIDVRNTNGTLTSHYQEPVGDMQRGRNLVRLPDRLPTGTETEVWVEEDPDGRQYVLTKTLIETPEAAAIRRDNEKLDLLIVDDMAWATARDVSRYLMQDREKWAGKGRASESILERECPHLAAMREATFPGQQYGEPGFLPLLFGAVKLDCFKTWPKGNKLAMLVRANAMVGMMPEAAEAEAAVKTEQETAETYSRKMRAEDLRREQKERTLQAVAEVNPQSPKLPPVVE
jgi:hypothetical protein